MEVQHGRNSGIDMGCGNNMDREQDVKRIGWNVLNDNGKPKNTPAKSHIVHPVDPSITWCGYKIPSHAVEGAGDVECKACRNKEVKRGKKKD